MSVPSSLCFVEHDRMFVRYCRFSVAQVLPEEICNVLNARPNQPSFDGKAGASSSSAFAVQGILGKGFSQNHNKRSVAGQIDNITSISHTGRDRIMHHLKPG